MVTYGYHRPIKTNELRNSWEGGCTHFPCRLWSGEFIPHWKDLMKYVCSNYCHQDLPSAACLIINSLKFMKS